MDEKAAINHSFIVSEAGHLVGTSMKQQDYKERTINFVVESLGQSISLGEDWDSSNVKDLQNKLLPYLDSEADLGNGEL
jgi:hypothetical protein